MGETADLASTNIKSSSRGFTIVELLIATAVFSIVLLAAVSGFLQIGRLFYRGVNANHTQTVTKQLLDQISSDIQSVSTITGLTTGSGGYTYFCIGNVRYTLNFDKRFDVSATQDLTASNGNFGVLRDELPGATACAEPCVTGCGPTQAAFNEPKEMLGNGMRLDELSLSLVTGQDDMRNVKVRMVYGDDSTLTVIGTPPANQQNYRCDANSSVSNFCAESYMSNAVFAGGF